MAKRSRSGLLVQSEANVLSYVRREQKLRTRLFSVK